MNDNAKAWVKALRSGGYSQTTWRLRDDSAYCCLGVACDLYGKQRGVEWSTSPDVDGEWVFLDEETALPDDVQKWLGLNDYTGDFNAGSLIGLNDGGKTFAEIADLIESEPDGLFS